MRLFRTLSILAAIIPLAACDNTIRYDLDLNDGEITMLAQLSSSDNLHSVYLSMSYPDRIDSLPGATVDCYVNGVRSAARQVSAGYEETYDWQSGGTVLVPVKNKYTRYDFEATFKPGDEVRVEASKGDYKVWSEVVVPQPITFVSLDTATVVKTMAVQYFDGTETYEQEYLEFSMRLKDVAGVDNYYSLNGWVTTVTTLTSEGQGENRVDVEGPSWISYDTFHDLILEDGYSSGLGDLFDGLMPTNETHCFCDKYFRDSEALVRFYIPSYYFNYYQYFHDADRIAQEKIFRFDIKSFDRDFYNYLRALNNMECYGYEVLPIIEPTTLPCNVEGGMGMVSIAADTSFEIPLKPFVYYREDLNNYPYYR